MEGKTVLFTFGLPHPLIPRGRCCDRRIEPGIRIAGNSMGLMIQWNYAFFLSLSLWHYDIHEDVSWTLYRAESTDLPSCTAKHTPLALLTEAGAGRYYMCTAHIILTTGKTFSLIPSNSKKWSGRPVSMFINGKRLKAVPLSFEIHSRSLSFSLYPYLRYIFAR